MNCSGDKIKTRGAIRWYICYRGNISDRCFRRDPIAICEHLSAMEVSAIIDYDNREFRQGDVRYYLDTYR